jgi:hypothetical protein
MAANVSNLMEEVYLGLEDMLSPNPPPNETGKVF